MSAGWNEIGKASVTSMRSKSLGVESFSDHALENLSRAEQSNNERRAPRVEAREHALRSTQNVERHMRLV